MVGELLAQMLSTVFCTSWELNSKHSGFISDFADSDHKGKDETTWMLDYSEL